MPFRHTVSNLCKEVLTTATADFDWEVKVTAMSLCHSLVKHEFQELETLTDNGHGDFPEYAKGLSNSQLADVNSGLKNKTLDPHQRNMNLTLEIFDRLCSYGVLDAIKKGLNDYEEKVSETAFDQCVQFKRKLVDHLDVTGICEGCVQSSVQTNSEGPIQTECYSLTCNANDISTCDENHRCDDRRPLCDHVDSKLLKEKMSDLYGTVKNKDLLEEILCLNTNSYNRGKGTANKKLQLLSVIEDILSTVTDGDEDNDDNVIDCY